jgi:hypothetical protein
MVRRLSSAKSAKAPIPFLWVLDQLEGVVTEHKPMFGCRALYVAGKIVLILRDRASSPADNGVWVATVAEHHRSLRAQLPGLRSIAVFGPGETGWQVIPKEHPEFEGTVERAIALVRAGDPRIGKTPATRGSKRARAEKLADEGISMADEQPSLKRAKAPKRAPKTRATKTVASSTAARSPR